MAVLIDTGAGTSAVSEAFFNTLPAPQRAMLRKTDLQAWGVGAALQVLGFVPLRIQQADAETSFDALVICGMSLASPVLVAMNALNTGSGLSITPHKQHERPRSGTMQFHYRVRIGVDNDGNDVLISASSSAHIAPGTTVAAVCPAASPAVEPLLTDSFPEAPLDGI